MSDRRFNEQEIDLLDFMLRLAEQWRGILIAGIVSAILISSIMVIKQHTSNINNNIDLKTNDSNNTGDDYQQMCIALSHYTDYLLAKKSYDNSVLIRSDYKDVYNVALKYQLEVGRAGAGIGSESPNSASDVFVLISLYSSITDDGDFTETILAEANKLWNDVSLVSLNEIFSVSYAKGLLAESSETGLLTINFTVPQGANTQELEQVISEALNAYRQKISKRCVEHDLLLISTTQTRIDNDSIAAARNERFTALLTAKQSYDKSLAELSEDKKTLVNKIINDNTDSYDITSYINSLDTELDKARSKSDQREQLQTSSNSNIKYVFSGFILGCFIYAGIYFIYFVFIRLVRDENILNKAAGTRNLGGIYAYPYTSRFQKFLHDKKVYSYRTRKGKSIEAISEDIVSKLNYTKVNTVTLISVGKMSEGSSSFANSQIRYLSDHQLTVSQLSIKDDVSSVRDSKFTEMKDVIILLVGNRSKWADVCALYFKLREYEINIVGSEYIEA